MDTGLSMHKEDISEKALRLKGYGCYGENVPESDYKKFEQVTKVDKNLIVKPTVITCLKDYVEFIGTLRYSYENPVFYRGQGNANYTIVPTSLRINPANEYRIIESFERRFSNEMNACENDMARLMLLQHFGVSTRALDISESPRNFSRPGQRQRKKAGGSKADSQYDSQHSCRHRIYGTGIQPLETQHGMEKGQQLYAG